MVWHGISFQWVPLTAIMLAMEEDLCQREPEARQAWRNHDKCEPSGVKACLSSDQHDQANTDDKDDQTESPVGPLPMSQAHAMQWRKRSAQSQE